MSAGPSPCAMLNNKGDVHYIVAPANKNRIYRLMLTEPRTGTGCTQAGASTNGSRHAHTHALIRSSWRRARGGKEKKQNKTRMTTCWALGEYKMDPGPFDDETLSAAARAFLLTSPNFLVMRVAKGSAGATRRSSSSCNLSAGRKRMQSAGQGPYWSDGSIEDAALN